MNLLWWLLLTGSGGSMARADAFFLELAGYGGGWTEVTEDLAGNIRMRRGFQSDAPDDLVAAPSQLEFELLNSDDSSGGAYGYYSPDYSGCRVGFDSDIRVRWDVTVNGTTRTRFIGWIQDVQPDAGYYDGSLTTKVMAESWLRLAAKTSITDLGQAINKRADELLPLVVALAEHPPAAESYGTTADTYPYAFDDLTAGKSTLLDAIDSIARSGFDRIFERANGTLVLEPRSVRQAFIAPSLLITDVPPLGQPGLAIARLNVRKNSSALINRVEVTLTPRRSDSSTIVLYSLDVSTDPTIGVGETVTLDAPYVDPEGQASRIAGVSMQISDGAGGSITGESGSLPTSDYQFLTEAGGFGTDISAGVSVDVVYGMNKATFTITNTTGVLAHYNRLRCRGRGLFAYNSVVATAVAAGGGQMQAFACPYQNSLSVANRAANYYLGIGQRRRLQIDGVQLIIPATDLVTLGAIHQYGISASIAIAETVTGIGEGASLGGTDAVYFIDSEEWEVDPLGNSVVTYGLDIVPPGSAWALGVEHASELGETTYLRGF